MKIKENKVSIEEKELNYRRKGEKLKALALAWRPVRNSLQNFSKMTRIHRPINDFRKYNVLQLVLLMCFSVAVLDRSALHNPLVDLLRYYVEGISH